MFKQVGSSTPNGTKEWRHTIHNVINSMFTFGNDIVSEIYSLMKKGSHETF
jgi:hypothetical protein